MATKTPKGIVIYPESIQKKALMCPTHPLTVQAEIQKLT